MIYAQIKNNKVQNTIVLEDASLESTFAQGFDVLVRIDNLTPQPGIGWSYDGMNFSAPLESSPSTQQLAEQAVTNDMNFGQSLITQFAATNNLNGISTSGKTLAVLSYTSNLSECLYTGSLQAALSIMEGMLADNSAAKTACAPYITNDIINSYIAQIQSYLSQS